AVSANGDCSSPITLIDHSAAPVTVDFMSNPDLGTASLAAGTYRCAIIEMSDVIQFTPAANDGAYCAAGTTYTMDVCHGVASRRVAGPPSAGSPTLGGEDPAALSPSQASADITPPGDGFAQFLPPAAPGDPVNGLRLTYPLVVTSDTSGTLVFDGRG